MSWIKKFYVYKIIFVFYKIILSSFFLGLSKIRYFFGKELYRSSRVTTVRKSEGGIFNLYKGKRPDYKVLEGSFDSAVLSLYKNMIGNGWVVVDVGANIGLHTVCMSKLVGDNGKVYSVEPVDYNLIKLNANLHLNNCQNVSVIDCVIGNNVKDEVTIYKVKEKDGRLDNSSVANNINIKKLRDNGVIEEVQVKQITIDSLASFSGEKINLIKIDVVGYEIEALKGALETIKTHRPILIIEVNPKRLLDLSVDISEYTSIICNYYDCYEILNPNIYEDNFSLEPLLKFEEKKISSDVLCIPKIKIDIFD